MFNDLKRIADALETIAENTTKILQNQEKSSQRAREIYSAGQKQASEIMGNLSKILLPPGGDIDGK